MFNTRVILLALFCALLGIPLAAQPAQFGYRVRIPSLAIPYSVLGAPDKTETLHLQWDYVRPGTAASAPTPVTRTVRISSTEEVTYAVSPASGAAPENPARAYPGSDAAIFPDEKDASILRVNFWLQPGGIQWKEDDGRTVTLPPDSVRKIDFYYRLKNRQSISFRTRAWSVGAITLPLRIRPGYTENGVTVPTTGGALAAGVYGGPTWGRARYTYIEHTKTTVDPVWAITPAVLLTASYADVDSTTSRTAAKPLTAKETIAVLSPGLGLLARVRGIEVGLFGGLDYGLGRNGRAWDYQGRPWIGAGLGFNVWKL